MTTINEQIQLETETCCNCGTVFAMTSGLRRNRLENGGDFYCPNGHGQRYTKPKVKELQERLDAAEANLRSQKCETLREKNLREQEQVAREKAEKKLRRVDKGVCPCCNRTFQNLARHMATKHKTETSTNK